MKTPLRVAVALVVLSCSASLGCAGDDAVTGPYACHATLMESGCQCFAPAAAEVTLVRTEPSFVSLRGRTLVTRTTGRDEETLTLKFDGVRPTRLTFRRPQGALSRVDTAVGERIVQTRFGERGMSGYRDGGEGSCIWTADLSSEGPTRIIRFYNEQGVPYRWPYATKLAPGALPALPICRCGEREDLVRDADGALVGSSCTRAGADEPRVRVDYDPRGLPTRIDELREDGAPVALPEIFPTNTASRAPSAVPARRRAVVMRWAPEGQLRSVHVELDGHRYGPAAEMLGDGATRGGVFYDDVQVGIWLATDAAGKPISAVDHGPEGGDTKPIPIADLLPKRSAP